MTLYLYKTGTNVPVLTIENVQNYTSDSVTALETDGSTVTYGIAGSTTGNRGEIRRPAKPGGEYRSIGPSPPVHALEAAGSQRKSRARPPR